MLGDAPPSLWAAFLGFIGAMLALDLGVFHRKAHAVGPREAAVWGVVWVGLALLFNLGLWRWYGEPAERGRLALEFFTGYLIEKSLSVDNVFVFLVIFSYFRTPPELQHRVLFWGIVGAIGMRGIFILLGAYLIARFHWILYVFGGFLVLTAVKLFFSGGEGTDPGRNPVLRLLRRVMPLTPDYDGTHFIVRRDGRWSATPLLLVLVVVETTDLIFAVDSIPAIFAVTENPFIVFTSNILAILGLRALYFLLAAVMASFRYLRTGLALILGFVGVKMTLVDVYKIPILVSLSVIALILAVSVVASLLVAPRKPREGRDPRPGGAGGRQTRSRPRRWQRNPLSGQEMGSPRGGAVRHPGSTTDLLLYIGLTSLRHPPRIRPSCGRRDPLIARNRIRARFEPLACPRPLSSSSRRPRPRPSTRSSDRSSWSRPAWGTFATCRKASSGSTSSTGSSRTTGSSRRRRRSWRRSRRA
jgi:tellurite resistance protein TerC